MTTDKQRAIAAIDLLNTARDLLESSSDQAQHEIAEEVGTLVEEIKNLKFFGRSLVRPLAYSFSFDADRLDGKQWVVTEEFRSGYSVIGEFPTRDAAVDYVETISNGGRR